MRSQSTEQTIDRGWHRTLAYGFMLLLSLCGWTFINFMLPPAVARAEAQIQTGTTPTHAYLQIGNQVLLDQPGFHLSQPQISPDKRWLAVTLVPIGTGTATLAETYLFAISDGQLAARLNGHSPNWSADSRQIQIERGEGTFVYHLAEQRLQQQSIQTRQPPEALVAGWSQSSLAYPQMIRVAHHPSNGCRTVPEWQVDTLPFEAYVARVLPAEVPTSWPAAAIEAMAVAARTYAWQQILAGRSEYDVTDWANFQMMCDERYPSTDAAVDTTAGQYLTAKDGAPGFPISAMYSAENGHPTLTNPNVTYLQAVPDLFSIGHARWGHGYGLSQWGAYRRALAGQNYRQILAHYYSHVYLQNGLDPAQPVGGLVGLLPQTALATDSLYLRSLVPNDASARLVITASAGLTIPVTLLGDKAIWRADPPLPEGTQVTAQLWVQEQLADQLSLTVDRSAPPMPALQTPDQATQPLIIFALPTLADGTPIVYTNWAWQGETLLHTINSGAIIQDSLATDGVAWQARAGVHQKGVWYGPHTTILPASYRYRALFWLRVGEQLSVDVADHFVARLDVTDDGGRAPLGLRDLWTSDFAGSDYYTPIGVDFHLFADARGVEFRVAWPGLVDLALDRVEIWRLPTSTSPTHAQFSLPFYGQQGNQLIQAAQMDSAGNLSQPASRAITLVDSEAPHLGPWPLPTTWITTSTITVAIPITDSFSGLDRSQGRFVTARESFSVTIPATFPTDKLAWQSQSMTGVLGALADGEYMLRAQATDLAGNVRTLSYPLRIDTLPPTIAAQISAMAVNGWYSVPVTLSLAATDNASGVAQIVYERLSPPATGGALAQPYTQPITLTTGGIHRLTYWAADQAGNVATRNTLTVALDLTAPLVLLNQYSLRTNLVRVAWQITDDGAGVAEVEMQVQQGDGEWQDAPWDYTTHAAADISLDPEIEMKVRARARDHFGRTSVWVTIALWHAPSWLYLPIVQQ